MKGVPIKGISRDSVERCARMYRSSADAARAMGISVDSFGKLCREYGIKPPHVRRANVHRGEK